VRPSCRHLATCRQLTPTLVPPVRPVESSGSWVVPVEVVDVVLLVASELSGGVTLVPTEVPPPSWRALGGESGVSDVPCPQAARTSAIANAGTRRVQRAMRSSTCCRVSCTPAKQASCRIPSQPLDSLRALELFTETDPAGPASCFPLGIYFVAHASSGTPRSAPVAAEPSRKISMRVSASFNWAAAARDCESSRERR
jgi:hypothetical protein